MLINDIYQIDIFKTQLYGQNPDIKDILLIEMLDIADTAFEFNKELFDPNGHKHYYVRILGCRKNSSYQKFLNKTLLIENKQGLYKLKNLGKFSENSIKSWKILYG